MSIEAWNWDFEEVIEVGSNVTNDFFTSRRILNVVRIESAGVRTLDVVRIVIGSRNLSSVIIAVLVLAVLVLAVLVHTVNCFLVLFASIDRSRTSLSRTTLSRVVRMVRALHESKGFARCLHGVADFPNDGRLTLRGSKVRMIGALHQVEGVEGVECAVHDR